MKQVANTGLSMLRKLADEQEKASLRDVTEWCAAIQAKFPDLTRGQAMAEAERIVRKQRPPL